MKFLKSQNTSRYSPSDNSFQINPYGRAVMDINGAVMLPKGPQGDRPNISGVRQPVDGNGYIRYNTDTDSIEATIQGNWQVVTAPAVSTITKQTLGPGDYSETLFGPLTIVPANADNVLVFVENVFQISTTNFTLEQSVGGALTFDNGDPVPDGWYLQFTSPVPLDKYITVYFGFAN